MIEYWSWSLNYHVYKEGIFTSFESAFEEAKEIHSWFPETDYVKIGRFIPPRGFNRERDENELLDSDRGLTPYMIEIHDYDLVTGERCDKTRD